MYGSESATFSLPRPFPLYLPLPPNVAFGNPVHATNDTSEIAYCSQLPQESSAENYQPKRNDPPSSDNRDFSYLFASYVNPISSPCVSTCLAQGIMSSELRVYDNDSGGIQMVSEGGVDDEQKREREHRKRSKNWTRVEIVKLIRSRSDIDAKFGKTGRRSELWDEIAENLHKDNFARDAQQCKDKWEKLSAGYKEVRDGIRDKEDFPYFDELHLLLSGRLKRRERERGNEYVPVKDKLEVSQIDDKELDLGDDFQSRVDVSPPFSAASKDPPGNILADQVVKDEPAKKSKLGPKYPPVADLSSVQELLESVLARQQRFFTDLLDALEKKEQLREQLRQEREDKWRAEEREQRCLFNNAMLFLTQQLLGGRGSGAGVTSTSTSSESLSVEHGESKKRSRNWKRSEVLKLIKLRGEMDSKFATPSRRAALWEELSRVLGTQGVRREGKQCREKWDKLMAEFKDVTDGRRDENESPFYWELKAFMEEGHLNI